MTLSNDRVEADLDVSSLQQISLLEEKLQVARRREKVGEVVIRKQVETRMVHLPIRREKLIVERIGNDTEKLAEVIISEETVNGIKYDDLSQDNNLDQSQSKFVSLSVAKELLSKLEELPSSNRAKIRLEIVTNNPESELSAEIKNLCDRY